MHRCAAALRNSQAAPCANRLPALALAACAALAGCQARTYVSATGNVSAQYAHVYVTAQAVWFNSSAGAGPQDAGWQEFPLSTPETFDLAALTSGTLTQFATDLKLTAGTYNAARLVLTDSSAPLTASAQALGALYNDEVDYYDSSGVLHQLPLQIPNSAQGIAVAMTLTVPLEAPSISSTGTTTTGTTTTGTTTTGTSTTTTGTTTSTNTTSVTVNAAIDFDASRDLTSVLISGQPGFLLSPRLTGYDESQSGTIQGTLDVTALPVSSTSGQFNVQVSAENLSADGTRHVFVASAPVNSAGSFVLYPLPNPKTSNGLPVDYDLVIHGPGIATVIVRSVPVAAGAPGSASSSQLNGVALVPASTFTANLAASPGTPLGVWVGFYQTLTGSGQVPYLIEQQALDPFTGSFDTAQTLSSANIQVGTYNTSGGVVTLANTAPAEGAATYHVAGSAPVYGDGPFASTVAAPASGTAPATFTLAALLPPSGASAASASGTVSVARPGKYDKGELLLTHNGSLVTALPLDAFLTSSQTTTTFASLPGGGASGSFASALYEAEVWVWNSANPAGTFTREPQTGTFDLRAGSASGLTITVN